MKSFKGQDNILDNIDKALESGYEINPTKMEGGSTFRKEELEDSLHNLSYVIDDEENKNFLKQKLSKKKSMTTGELVVYLQLCKGLSREDADSFIKHYVM